MNAALGPSQLRNSYECLIAGVQSNQMISFYGAGNNFDPILETKIRQAKLVGAIRRSAELLVEDMKIRNTPMGNYDVILVDEAQDMENWALEMVELYTERHTTVCVAAGAGQELYGTQSAWLAAFHNNPMTIKRRLRRNFRNTKPVFQLAQVAFEAKLDPEKIQRTVRRITTQYDKGHKGRTEIEFAREEGRFPAMIYISEVSRFSWESEADFDKRWNDHMVDEYHRLIREQLENLDQDSRPIDILVLVPNTTGNERGWAVRALQKIAVPYMDYTQKTDDKLDNRRFVARADMVRLCTFHSARGLEGQRVLAFGLENLEKLADAVHADKTKIAYVVLSRATFETMICVRTFKPSTTVSFLEASLAELQHAKNNVR